MDNQKKEIWSIDKLHSWDKNPRDISPDELEKLRFKIQKHGQFKPLLITPDGEIIGGNMRFRAYTELGIKDIWVSIVDPKDDTEKLEISLADNEASGFYIQDALAGIVKMTDIDRDLYSINLESGKSLTDIMDQWEPVDPNPPEQTAETFDAEVLIEIKTSKNVYLKIKDTLDKWEEEHGLEYNVS